VKRLACGLVLMVLAGCREDEHVKGAVGVFYGGQVQELEQVTLDPVRAPSFGIRVEFPESVRGQDHDVRWEVVRPGPLGRRVTEVGELRVNGDRAALDQVLPIDLREAPGLANVRVVVDGQLVIDRAIDVRKP
jgi:hypothetical protein